MTLKISELLQADTPIIMGILNVTPDSFSDGGLFLNKTIAMKHVNQMILDGASIIDVGGESTRPGAKDVSVDEELERVIPVIEMIREETDIPVSIDSSKPQVMQQAILAGANMINDVNALREEHAVEMAVKLDVPVCLMHMKGIPRTMQQTPHYKNVTEEVKTFLSERISVCLQAGMASGNIIIDPGFGFGKTVQHNFSLFKHMQEFNKLGYPVLIGVSRKSMIGAMLNGAPVEERLYGSIALATLAAWNKAKIIRVHDVKATADAIALCRAVQQADD